MWSAKLLKKTYSTGTITLLVEYVNGDELIQEIYTTSDPDYDLITIARKKIKKLEGVHVKFDSLVVGNIDVSEPPTVIDPDKELQMQYIFKKAELDRANYDLSLGLITKIEFDKILLETKTLYNSIKEL